MHDKNMLLARAQGRGKAFNRSYRNTPSGRRAMIRSLKEETDGANIIFAYEASCQGFGLYDELTEAGIECYVLAPTKIARSLNQRRSKTDQKDALRLLELLRGHVLAGNELPSVWVPPVQIRDDREVVRARLDAAGKVIGVKNQIKTLLKRNGLKRPSGTGKGWTKGYRRWLKGLLCGGSVLREGGQVGLGSLVRQLDFLEEEIARLDVEVRRLSVRDRYSRPFEALCREKGVGLLTAMVFLTEMGDLSRFSNRRQVGSYLGLAPSSRESGEACDRKGHITHHGNSRVRAVLCQAVWSRVRTDCREKEVYERIVRRNPKNRKIAVVAIMRRLAVRLWRRGKRAGAA